MTAATAQTTTAQPTPTTTASPPPCVGAGAVAIFAPGAAPIVLGPSVAAAAAAGITASTVAAPDDGSLVALSHLRAGTVGCRAGRAPGGAAMSLESLRLFGGAVAAGIVTTDLVPATTSDGSGWRVRAAVSGLTVDGKPAMLRREQPVPVGDWATIRVPARAATTVQPLAYWAAAFEIVLRKAHGGYPADTTIFVGYVSADEPPASVPPSHLRAALQRPAQPRKAHRRNRKRTHRSHAKHVPASHPLKVTPPLRGGPYVFPVFAHVSVGDTYGAGRSDVSGGWHHGDDIFAPLGTPILAVTEGVVYSVGWNELGGWRLWLRDRQGNRFYYAHLSGYTALAHDGEHVKAGQVLAFLGNTGDAFTTPTHLHFEIHPVSLLHLGYDGAVDPTGYLDRWRRLDHVDVLRPTALPPGATSHGSGAVTDYRKLLAVRGLTPHQHRHGRPRSRPVTTRLPLPPLKLDALGAHPIRPQRSGSHAPLVVSVLAALLMLVALTLRLPPVRRLAAARVRRRSGGNDGAPPSDGHD